METLNSQQKQAVQHIDDPLLVLAGAGSGKTKVITHKIAYLIQTCGFSARSIAAVTFTNKAAREMKDRISQLLPKEKTRGLTVSTFHTLGLNILRREWEHLNLKKNFSLLDSQDSLSLIADICQQEYTYDGDKNNLQWQISAWKNALITPEQALNQGGNPQENLTARVYTTYERRLRSYNAVDFDDLIVLPLYLFTTQTEVLNRWQNYLHYLLVDEYQDTNEAQYQLIKALAGVRSAFTVVGDDDQSIYTWRGARPENLYQLKEDFPRLTVIKLEQNYRSTTRILRVANQLISQNSHIFEKRLWSTLGEGNPIQVISCQDEFHEADKVIAQLMYHQFKHRCTFKDYAILYRGNYQSRLFEKALRTQGIPYTLSGGTSFFDRTEVKDIMAYLRLLTNGDDDHAFLRIVNTPRRGIGAVTLEKLAQYATHRDQSLLGACFEVGLNSQLPEEAVEKLYNFARWIIELGDQGQRSDPIEVVKDLIKESNYYHWLDETCNDPRAVEKKTGNIEDLVQWLARLYEQGDNRQTLSDLVAHISLQDILERNQEKKSQDTVNLSTLHAAKGLEFPHVFMVGMEEELLPHRNSIEQDIIEEERRLAYVGITRAQRNLWFTLAEKRQRYGEAFTCQPSRFLSELPSADLRWEDQESSKDPAERIQRGKAHLAHLRTLLN
ncbi:DNA helicase Rep [Candidatus Nitrosacidococcus tergens]|uniref:ATP-dependent DNA helicase Rep n=1 Tax=Candidatus Nitrosacidococcus tergens TaxID=553981 RepID=A0A7G1QAM4_9GAMM|nr:DNA helicase Rep [Candidatus Nitrosacidococcus tergens]CAB1276799.1 DNA helicase and single-stranded DNA-dependent ATPase [Candidatus Nitrosacidococcus tergens]